MTEVSLLENSMIVLRGVVVAWVAGSLVLFGIVGCGAKQQSTMEPAIEQRDAEPQRDAEATSANQVGPAVAAFEAARQGLVGHGDEQARRQLAGALRELADVLVALHGPRQTGRFRQQVRIIERAAERLTDDVATAPEPTINSAIRSAQWALADMAGEKFAADEQTKALADALEPRVDVLNTVRGPLHGFETARALDAIGAVVQRMAEVVQQRSPQQSEADASATAPADKPQ